jgi:hypothetical protein
MMKITKKILKTKEWEEKDLWIKVRKYSNRLLKRNSKVELVREKETKLQMCSLLKKVQNNQTTFSNQSDRSTL